MKQQVPGGWQWGQRDGWSLRGIGGRWTERGFRLREGQGRQAWWPLLWWAAWRGEGLRPRE